MPDGDGESGGPRPNKTKNGSPFTMPRIYIISRNLRHFRPRPRPRDTSPTPAMLGVAGGTEEGGGQDGERN
jgi:hypothetical protein